MPAQPGSLRRAGSPVEVRRLGTVDYRTAYDDQHALAADRASGTLDHDLLLLLEHPSTYTAGKRTEESDLPTDGSEVVTVDRGGRITWHGPGQLVGYPIVALREPLDVVDYVRRIEQALIDVCTALGVTAGRIDGRSGVWLSDGAGERKIAQIGIRVARGVALHGFALNVDPDLSAFDAIVPCGIADAGVTSLARELNRPISVDEVSDAVAAAVTHWFDHPLSAGDEPAAHPPALSQGSPL
ncbi:lipoyl(octanoyl) transferase LipB [Gordonia crocea]|uniref:Octanoyltransferase n=1 Tax=Gordonia crocea TaxID=589162 RepID=A0A7I9UZH6_9ACTN|nr:lipoyl(octanoyl) transferase LipB [Gordonia crocea]GED98587.1 octanoyltransferase [Gordonia crocea]